MEGDLLADPHAAWDHGCDPGTDRADQQLPAEGADLYRRRCTDGDPAAALCDPGLCR